MGKIEDKLKKRKLKREQQHHFVPIAPIETTEKIKIVELDLISSAYFNPEVEEESFNIGEDEIQFMIDSITEQRNDLATKAAAYKARNMLYHAAIIERNTMIKNLQIHIANLENQLEQLNSVDDTNVETEELPESI